MRGLQTEQIQQVKSKSMGDKGNLVALFNKEVKMNQAYRNGQKLLRGAYTQYTPSGKALFEKAGSYHKEPRLGDIVYFYSNSMGRVCHVGAVVSVKKEGTRYTIEAVEGNTNGGDTFNRNGGCVAKKRYSFALSEVGGVNRINGFGTPEFGENTCTVDEFVKVLNQEIGYIEKANNKDLESKTANPGTANYTKYGQWYGGNGLYWCQQFISWCAYMACKNHRENAFTGWEKLEDKWMYQVNGVYVADRWMKIEGRWYVFDGASYMITGWFKSEDSWYYLNPADGAMLSKQWLELDGKTYYLDENGVMVTNCYIKDSKKGIYYWVNSEGAYEKEHDTDSPDLATYELAI